MTGTEEEVARRFEQTTSWLRRVFGRRQLARADDKQTMHGRAR